MPIPAITKGVTSLLSKGTRQSDAAGQAIGRAAESAGMKAPVTADKSLTNLQDFHTSLGDRVRERVASMREMVESTPFKYDKGQRVFTEWSAKKNHPPYTILQREMVGNQPMREGNTLIGKPIKDELTGKTKRTPYEPGYRVRQEMGDEWSEFQIPESVIKGDVEMAVGGVVGGLRAASKMKAPATAVNRLDMNFKDVTKRVPELTDAANMLARGEMTAGQYDSLVRKLKPVTPYDFVPQPATLDDAMRALTENKRSMFGKSTEMSAGEQADLRLDIPAYKDHGVWVNSIHRKDQPTVYGSTSSVKNATMIGAPDKALKVAQGGPKAPFAVIRGDWNPMDEAKAVKNAQKYLNNPDWKQVGYDPERHGFFYDRATMTPIIGADEVIQIGPLVLAKKPKYGKAEDFPFKKGGGISMQVGGIVGGLRAASKASRAKTGMKFADEGQTLNVTKDGGGNWVAGDVEYRLSNLKRDPTNPTNEAVNLWIDKNLTNYVKKDMATPQDPVRRLLDKRARDVTAMQTTGQARLKALDERIAKAPAVTAQDIQKLNNLKLTREQNAARLDLDVELALKNVSHIAGANNFLPEVGMNMMAKRAKAGHPEPMGESRIGKIYENEVDRAVATQTVGETSAAPWMEGLAPGAKVHRLTGDLNNEFEHMVDILRADLRSGAITPDQLKNISVADAAERTAKYNLEASKRMHELNIGNSANLPVHKAQPEGYKWLEIAMAKDMPEGWAKDASGVYIGPRGERTTIDPRRTNLQDALTYEGDRMGHCVGTYCDDVIEGQTRIFSLRDARNEPHATIDVGSAPIRTWEDLNKTVGEKRAQELWSQFEGGEGLELENFARNHDIKVPPFIRQIKGKSDTAVNPKYQSFVHDFVKSGHEGNPWSEVRDLHNAGLRDMSKYEPLSNWRKGKGGDDLPRYVSEKEFGDLEGDFLLHQLRPSVEGFAVGGILGAVKAGAKAGTKADDIVRATAADRARAANIVAKQDKDFIKPSEFYGGLNREGTGQVYITQSDRTKVGGQTSGGAMFPALQHVDPFYKDVNAAWGVRDKGAASRLVNLSNEDSLFTTLLGSEHQLKTNPVVFNQLYSSFNKAVKSGEVPAEKVDQINSVLKGLYGETADITSPKFRGMLEDNFAARADVADLIRNAGVVGSPPMGGITKGFGPKAEAIVRKNTEPSLRHTQHGGTSNTYDVGPRVFTLDKSVVDRPDLNLGYPKILGGKDFGVNVEPTAAEIFLPDFYDKVKAVRGTKPGYMDFTRGIKGDGLPSQRITEEWLTHLQKQGKKDGGSVTTLHPHLLKRLEAKMAAGGAVHMAGGGEPGFEQPEPEDQQQESAMQQFRQRELERFKEERDKLEGSAAFGVFPHMTPARKGTLSEVERRSPADALRDRYPEIYGGAAGLLGVRPDEMEGSALDPLTARVRKGADFTFPVGTALQVAPMGWGAAKVGAKALNTAVPAIRRPFTPSTLTVEATAPDLGQGTSYGFRQGLNDRLLGDLDTLNSARTKSREAAGAWRNNAGQMEYNPMQAVDVPFTGSIGEGGNRAFRQQVGQAGVDLNQEAMAAHRFIPLPINNIKDASSMLIKTKEGLTPQQVRALAERLGGDMAVSHNPRLGGVVVYPFGPVTKGTIPTEFLTAQGAVSDILGKQGKIQYGVSDYAKDRLFMGGEDYAKAGAGPAQKGEMRKKLQGVEKFVFPKSTSDIPGGVNPAPMGGLQGWSRGENYPTHVQGIGTKGEYRPVNYATQQEGARYPTYGQAEAERAKMLDAWHRTLPARVR